MSTQKKETSSAKETVYADAAGSVDSLLSDEKVVDKDFIIGSKTTDTSELDKSYENSSRKFRDQLTDDERAAISAKAPEIAENMLESVNRVMEFGSEVLDGVSQTTSRLLKEQSHVNMKEADTMMTNILRSLDKMEKKYTRKESMFLKKIFGKMKNVSYDIKTAARDAKSLEEKLDIAGRELYKMNLELQHNAVRGEALRDEMKESISSIVRVLAIFEEVIDYIKAELISMDDLVKDKEKDDSVVWKGEIISVDALRQKQAEYTMTFGEVEKTWYAWRQRLYFHNVHIIAANNIISTSASNQHVLNHVRREGIDTAKVTLAQWQQAEILAESAEIGNKVLDGINELAIKAAEGTAAAIENSNKLANRAIFDEETLIAMTNSLRSQFESIVTAEREGRAMRARNLSIIQQSEATISELEEKTQKQLIEDAMTIVRADAEVNETKRKAESSDILSSLGIK